MVCRATAKEKLDVATVFRSFGSYVHSGLPDKPFSSRRTDPEAADHHRVLRISRSFIASSSYDCKSITAFGS